MSTPTETTIQLDRQTANRIVHTLTACLFYLRDPDPELEKRAFDLAIALRIKIDSGSDG